MQKGFTAVYVIVGLVMLVAVAGGAYFLGSRNNQVTPQYQQSGSTPTPVASQPVLPTQSNTTKQDSTVPADWKVYTNQKYNYSVKYPSTLDATEETPYSALFNVIQTKPGPTGFPTFYVSVIPDGSTNKDSTIYNFVYQEDRDKFVSLQVGDSVNTRKGGVYSEFWTYKRLIDTTVDGLSGLVIENNKVWDGGNGLVDRRVFIRKNGLTYMLGTYYQNPQGLNNFQSFLSSFKLSK